jgi:hypothetical protein
MADYAFGSNPPYGLRFYSSADVTANWNEITNSSNTTENPVDISFHEARSHCPVDGCAASVYITTNAGGGQVRC